MDYIVYATCLVAGRRVTFSEGLAKTVENLFDLLDCKAFRWLDIGKD